MKEIKALSEVVRDLGETAGSSITLEISFKTILSKTSNRNSTGYN